MAGVWLSAAWRYFHELARRIDAHRISLAAAGCAFYATLALFPAVSMMISLFGLVLDPRQVEPQLALVAPLLPDDAFSLLHRLVEGLIAKRRGTLGLALFLGAAITLWSASTGVKSMLAALNLAYDEPERRGLLRFQLTGLAMTAIALLGAVLAVAVLVALPAAVHFLQTHAAQFEAVSWRRFWRAGMARLLHGASLAVMILYVTAALAGLYRFGPYREPGRHRRIMPGTLAALALWLIASGLFSLYTERLANFDATYGPLGAVATVMLWFWVSCYAVLVGAELNAVLEGARPPHKES